MRVHAHDYRGPDVSGIYDGAVLMHRQVLDLLDRRELHTHDLTAGPDCLADVRDGDLVYAGSGPYAFLYHHWRERTGREFRIAREVHTALWSGYWLQEELCAPLVRPGDVTLFPTAYTRDLYRRFFPSVDLGGSAVAYPMLADRARPASRPPAGRVLRVGYLGALSLAKNFDQVLDVFAALWHETGGAARLVCAGKPNDPRWERDGVRERIAGAGADPEAVRVVGTVPPERLGSFFEEVDVLLFPSTASRETLGRVVLEALEHGVPVLAADLGPAVELLPARNLLPASLDTTADFTMSRVVPLGRIDEEAAVAALVARDWAPPRFARAAPYQPDAFWEALAGAPAGAGPAGGDPAGGDPAGSPPADRRVLDALRVEERAGTDLRAAGQQAAAVVREYFDADRSALLRRVERTAAATARDRSALRAVVDGPDRNLADYRALPRLLDGLVLPALAYRLDGAATAAPPAPAPAGSAAGARTGGRTATGTRLPGEDHHSWL